MMLPRLHLVEFEDLTGFPAAIRDLGTDYLQFMQTRLRLHTAIVPLLREGLVASGSTDVIDLGSGGGGPVLGLQPALAGTGLPVRFTLTDRYPNLPAFEDARRTLGGDAIAFVAEPVDARAVPERLRGFRTLFNAFHHFAPDDALEVLRDAARAGQPVGVFELPQRSVRALLPFLFITPLAVAVVTPWIRPFRWRRLLFTYLLPLVPLLCWWDGIVSHLRAYTVEELEQFATAAAEEYVWRAGRVPVPGTPAHVTYLIGWPPA